MFPGKKAKHGKSKWSSPKPPDDDGRSKYVAVQPWNPFFCGISEQRSRGLDACNAHPRAARQSYETTVPLVDDSSILHGVNKSPTKEIPSPSSRCDPKSLSPAPHIGRPLSVDNAIDKRRSRRFFSTASALSDGTLSSSTPSCMTFQGFPHQICTQTQRHVLVAPMDISMEHVFVGLIGRNEMIGSPRDDSQQIPTALQCAKDDRTISNSVAHWHIPYMAAKCFFNDCVNPAASGSWKCRFHRKRSRCLVADCANQVHARRLCVRHGGRATCHHENCSLNQRVGKYCSRHAVPWLKKICTELGCEKQAHARGKCVRHGGGRQCKVQNCTKHGRQRGYCWKHARNGHETVVVKPTTASLGTMSIEHLVSDEPLSIS